MNTPHTVDSTDVAESKIEIPPWPHVTEHGCIDMPNLYAAARTRRAQVIRQFVAGRIAGRKARPEAADAYELEPLGVRV